MKKVLFRNNGRRAHRKTQGIDGLTERAKSSFPWLYYFAFPPRYISKKSRLLVLCRKLIQTDRRFISRLEADVRDEAIIKCWLRSWKQHCKQSNLASSSTLKRCGCQDLRFRWQIH